MNDALAGKLGWYAWNLSAFGSQPSKGLRALLDNSACNVLAIKTYDGERAFIRPDAFATVKRAMSDWPDVLVGAWGYHYGHNVQRELERAHDALTLYGADFLILNVEDPAIETNLHTPALWDAGLRALRARHPEASIYFCSHAQPAFHQRQPYYQAFLHGIIQQPMIYHTAMQRAPRDAVELSIQQFNGYGLLGDGAHGNRDPWSAGGAAYGELGYPITAEDLLVWARAAIDAGATSLIWWDGDVGQHRPDLLEAIRSIDMDAWSAAPPA